MDAARSIASLPHVLHVLPLLIMRQGMIARDLASRCSNVTNQLCDLSQIGSIWYSIVFYKMGVEYFLHQPQVK